MYLDGYFDFYLLFCQVVRQKSRNLLKIPPRNSEGTNENSWYLTTCKTGKTWKNSGKMKICVILFFFSKYKKVLVLLKKNCFFCDLNLQYTLDFYNFVRENSGIFWYHSAIKNVIKNILLIRTYDYIFNSFCLRKRLTIIYLIINEVFLYLILLVLFI